MSIEDKLETILASPGKWIDCSNYFDWVSIHNMLDILGIKHDIHFGTKEAGSLYGIDTATKVGSTDSVATWVYYIKIFEDRQS